MISNIKEKKKTYFVIGAFLLLITLSCIPNFFLRFIVTGIVNFLMAWTLLEINPFKKIGFLLIYFYSLLIIPLCIFAFYTNDFTPGIISVVIYLISSIFSILVFASKRKILYSSIYFMFFVILVVNHNNMYNFYNSIVNKNINIGKLVPEIEIIDKNGYKQLLKNDGKILIVDLWSNTCSNCIKAFPKFEKIKNDFKNDNEVSFLAINIYNKKSDILESEKYLKKYSFTNFYSDTLLYNKLNFNTVPNYMIIGKDKKIKYFGNLNMETSETYNNMYKLIENEK